MSKSNYEGVTLNLTPEKAEEVFYDSLCNGLGYFSGYGFSIDYTDEAYAAAKEQAKAKLPENSVVCREDVLMEILRGGGTIEFIDNECGGAYNRNLTLSMVHERVAKTPMSHLVDFFEGNDDATTADVVIQTVLFEEIVFG